MDNELEFSAQAFSKMVMHAMKYPHSTCAGFLLSPKTSGEENEGDKLTTRITEAIPVSHASQCLSPNIEIAFNSVSLFAEDQDLVISGYYQSENSNESNSLDIFSQRVAEKICETYPSAVLCYVGFEGAQAKTMLDCHQLIDGKWRRKSAQTFRIENDPKILSENILYSKEKLYRKIVDFDEHFNNIALDWTNAKISQRIDYLVANIC